MLDHLITDKITIRKVELNNLEKRSMKRIKIITIMITKIIVS